MTFELLISTMHKKNVQEIHTMLFKMNVKCNCVVINQCDEENVYTEKNGSQTILIIFTKERGLSKSRNMALRNATADIVCIADDDLFYYDNFDKTIESYYDKNKNADVVMFGIDSYRKQTETKEHKCNFLKLGTYISFQISFKRSNLVNKNISFNESFGTGSKVYDSGEENIFLADCFRAGLKLYFYPKKILKHEKSESTWFTGYNEKFISDRGAIYQAVYHKLSVLYIIRFAIKRRKLYNPITIKEALTLMLNESKSYKQKINSSLR